MHLQATELVKVKSARSIVDETVRAFRDIHPEATKRTKESRPKGCGDTKKKEQKADSRCVAALPLVGTGLRKGGLVATIDESSRCVK